MNDGTVEDGAITTCGVCGAEHHMHDDQQAVCGYCEAEGWGTTSAWKIRRGDVVAMVPKDTAVVEAEEPFDKRVLITVEDGRQWMKRATDRIYIQRWDARDLADRGQYGE